MGDRANVYVQGHDGAGVYLYTHWAGTELPATVQAALQRGKDRWDDHQYLARIVFCEMVAGFEKETTGFGISARVGDGDNRVLVLDPDAGRIAFGRVEDGEDAPTVTGAWMRFDDYCEWEGVTWPERG